MSRNQTLIHYVTSNLTDFKLRNSKHGNIIIIILLWQHKTEGGINQLDSDMNLLTVSVCSADPYIRVPRVFCE